MGLDLEGVLFEVRLLVTVPSKWAWSLNPTGVSHYQENTIPLSEQRSEYTRLIL